MTATIRRRHRVTVIGFLLAITAVHAYGLYKPGNIRKGIGLRTPLDPPSQEGVPGNYWKVADDIHLYYFARGEGRPVLVLHGGPGYPPEESWKGLERLEKTHKLMYYHQRGCGKSTKPVDRFASDNYFQNMMKLDQILGITAQLADIERIRRILGQEKLILIGHSFGGFLAALYAVEFPEHVEQMILVSPAGVLKMPVEEGGFEGLITFIPSGHREDFQEYLSRYFDFKTLFTKTERILAEQNLEFIRFFRMIYEGRGLKLPEGASLPVEEAGGWMVYAQYFSLGLKYDYRSELSAVKSPVLVIHGEKDPFPETVSREYSRLFPSGEFMKITASGHFPHLEQPEAFAKAAADFLGR